MSKEKEPAPAPATAAPAASVTDGAPQKATAKKKTAAKKAPAAKEPKAPKTAATAKKPGRPAKAKPVAPGAPEKPAAAKAPRPRKSAAKAAAPQGEAPQTEATKDVAPKAARPRKAAAKAETASAPQAPAKAETPSAAPAPTAPAPQTRETAPRPQAAPAPQAAAPAPAATPSERPSAAAHGAASPAAAAAPNDHPNGGLAAAPDAASGETPSRKKRRRRRHKNRAAQNAQDGAPAANGQNAHNPGAAPARPAPLPGNGPASYGAVIAAASAEHAAHDGAAPVRGADGAAPSQQHAAPAPASAPAPDDRPASGQPADGANGEGQGRKKRRRRRRRNKHGNGDNAAPDAQNGQNGQNGQNAQNAADAPSAPAPEGAAPAPSAPAAASAPALDGRPSGGQSPIRVPTGRRMLINVVDAGQARVAVVGRDGLEEIHIEKDGGRFVHGNIFKGRVDGVQPNLQAAFINIGGEKNAFLHVDDVVAPFGGYEEILGRRRLKAPTDTRDMRIEDMLVEGQEVLVQITREALVTKGPSVTTFLSIPGRYLVAMPNSTTRGVSKKITDDKERRELKKALEKLSPPKDMGYIIRTAGMGKGTEELQLDLDALNRMWRSIAEQAKKAKAPAVLYQENDLVIRTIRDNFRADIDEVYIDSAPDHARAMEFVNLMMPDLAARVKLYDRPTPMFHAFGIEEKISNLFNRSVKLKSGGEILLEQTEAMVTIDVNTGKMGQAESTREMILQANLEAAEAIAREIRLRDLGGLVMIDFIDMETAEDRKAVEQALRRATRGDPSRITILPISQLGVLEMTRQRLRQSLHHTHYRPCPYCGGAGMYKRPESLGVEFMRRLRTELAKKNVRKVTATFNPRTAFDMANEFRAQLAALEAEHHKAVVLAADPSYTLDRYTLTDSQ